MKKYMLGFLLLSVGSVSAMDLNDSDAQLVKSARCSLVMAFVKSIYNNVLQPLGDFIYRSNPDYAELFEMRQEMTNERTVAKKRLK